MFKKVLITAVLVTVAIAINGAGPTSASGEWPQDLRPVPSVPTPVDSAVDPGETGDEVREEFHQTYPLSPTGRVSLENINGGVQIKVWDRPAVQVDAVKKAYRKERLNEAKIEVNSTDENLRIKTEYPSGNQTFRSDERRYDNPSTVDYTLTIPRKAALESIELVNGSLDIEAAEGTVKASSINGKVTARGLVGDVKLSTINGQLHATFAQLDPVRAISLGSVNGSVVLVIPSDSNAVIRAGTVHGGISNDFGIQVKHGEYVGHNLEGQIGTGGPRIKLGNVNGQIRISRAQDGRTLSPGITISGTSAVSDVDIAGAVEQASEIAVATNVKVKIDSARMTRSMQRDAERQVADEIRRAQRELEMAQREVERERVRINRVKASGSGSGFGSGSGSGSGDNARFTAKETKTFSVSGSPRVNLCTFDGNITVHGWDKAEVMYTAVKYAESDEDLKQIAIQTEAQSSAVSIIAMSGDGHTGNANLEVFVPRKATLHVSSDDGGLKLDGVSGDITLRTSDGAIEVSNGSGALQLNTGDGRIQVLKFDGELDARTGDGSITLDGNFNALAARTGDGAISLTVPNGSNFTVETNADDDVSNDGLSVTEDVTPSRRVRRWRVGSGGKVFVLKTGDGKISLRSR